MLNTSKSENISRSWDNSNLTVPRHRLIQDENSSFSETAWNREKETHQAIDESDVECMLCYRLLYQPVTTVCGMSTIKSMTESFII